MKEMREYDIERILDTICKLENHLNEVDRKLAVLCEYEYRLEALKENINNHFHYTEKAVEKAEQAMNLRLTGMNAFREQLTEQSKTFMTFDIYTANHKTIEAKIEEIQKIVWSGLAIISFLVFAIPLVMHFLR
jgi:hypothetical protein